MRKSFLSPWVARFISASVLLLHYQLCHAIPLQTIVKVGGAALTAIGLSADLVGLGLAGNNAPPTLSLDVQADPYNLTVLLVGGAIDHSYQAEFKGTVFDRSNVTLPGGGTATQDTDYWTYDLIVNLANGALNDSMSINGGVQHVIGPDSNDARFGPNLTFNVGLSADTSTKGIQTKSATDPDVNHPHPHPGRTPPHLDTLLDATLTATIDGGSFLDDITGFTFKVQAEHSPDSGSTFLLLAIGMLIMGFKKSFSCGLKGSK